MDLGTLALQTLALQNSDTTSDDAGKTNFDVAASAVMTLAPRLMVIEIDLV